MNFVKTALTQKDIESKSKYINREYIHIGKVKDARPPNHDGSIMVWIVASDTNENDPANWIVAKSSAQVGQHSVGDNIESYGLNFNRPAVNDFVFIFFPYTGSLNSYNAYWFGSPNNFMMNMLPGISYNLYSKDNLAKNPATDIVYTNKQNVFKPLKNALKKQGLYGDVLRGPSSSSSVRDNPSRCYGFVSPLGNQMVIDDGWSLNDTRRDWVIEPRKKSITSSNNRENLNKDDYAEEYNAKEWVSELSEEEKENKLNRFHGGFRFRTRNGTQLLILDTGNIYMINKDGSAWVELSDDGYIDCYSKVGINANSDGNINLHSNADIKIEAENIHIRGNKHIELETPGNIDLNSGVTRNAKILTSPKMESETCMTLDLQSEKAVIKEGVFGGTLKGMAESASTLIPSMQVPQPEPVIDVAMVSVPADIEKQSMPLVVNGNYEETINTRIPTHEPYAEHDKNKCIPDLDISAKLINENSVKTTTDEELNSKKISNSIV